MPDHATIEAEQGNLLEHPAVKAWARLRPGRVEPARVLILKPEKNPNGSIGKQEWGLYEDERADAKQRAALLLSRMDGLAYRDVAEALGSTEGAVKALLFRATQTLKRGLREYL